MRLLRCLFGLFFNCFRVSGFIGVPATCLISSVSWHLLLYYDCFLNLRLCLVKLDKTGPGELEAQRNFGLWGVFLLGNGVFSNFLNALDGECCQVLSLSTYVVSEYLNNHVSIIGKTEALSLAKEVWGLVKSVVSPIFHLVIILFVYIGILRLRNLFVIHWCDANRNFVLRVLGEENLPHLEGRRAIWGDKCASKTHGLIPIHMYSKLLYFHAL